MHRNAPKLLRRTQSFRSTSVFSCRCHGHLHAVIATLPSTGAHITSQRRHTSSTPIRHFPSSSSFPAPQAPVAEAGDEFRHSSSIEFEALHGQAENAQQAASNNNDSTFDPRNTTDDFPRYANDTNVVEEVIQQLRRLASHKPHPATATAENANGEVDDDVQVSADALADVLSSPADMDNHDAPLSSSLLAADADRTQAEAQMPAWQAALQLAEKAAGNVEVAEWLLFVCLRSREAPLEVCDGVYQAWRQAILALNMAEEAQGAPSAAMNADLKQVDSFRPVGSSPFHPKGVHHHYATWLLKELYATHSTMREMRSHGDGQKHSSADVETTAAEYEEVEALHYTCLLLDRVFGVLLLELPLDESSLSSAAAASAAASASSVTLSKSQGKEVSRDAPRKIASPLLRPTTALLLLEASRHLAQLMGQPECLSVFPLLAFLSSPADNSNDNISAEAGVFSVPVKTTVLADVAREALQQVLRTSSPNPHTGSKGGSSGRSLQHSSYELQSDAVVLYLGFRMASPATTPSLLLRLAEVECFVRMGSVTAQRLAAETPDDRKRTEQNVMNVAAASLQRDVFTATVASAVRSLLISSRASAKQGKGETDTHSTHASDSAEETSTSHNTWTALMNLFAQNAPESLNKLFEVQGGAGAGYSAEGSSAAQRPNPTSWSAWVLRVLVNDLERIQRQQHQQQDTKDASVLVNVSSAASSTAAAAAAAALNEEWQRETEWTLRVTARLIMDLRQRTLAVAERKHTSKRAAVVAARRALQQTWRVVFLAALRGCFYFPTSAPEPHTLSASSSSSSYAPQPHRQPIRLSFPLATPRILQQLCYPHYDKTQWRGFSVNLYLQLLDQWGQGDQVCQVFAAVTRRELAYQNAVQAAVAAERAAELDGDTPEAEENTAESEVSNNAHNAREGSAPPESVVFRRYRPTLTLTSCLITLKHCGCPPRVLAQLNSSPYGVMQRNKASHGGLAGRNSSNGDDLDDEAPSLSARQRRNRAANARLAGEVLQYMLCRLHVVERTTLSTNSATGLSSDEGNDQPALDESAEDEENEDEVAEEGEGGRDTAGSAGLTEGYTVQHWVRWMGDCCVPAVEKMFYDAGMEEEWAALGY